jgi:phage terminase large subunit-like protein
VSQSQGPTHHRKRRQRSTISRNYQSDDYILCAIAYAEDAIADTKGLTYGTWIRLAARRFMRDLKATQGKRPPFVWSANQAIKACKFIERLPHVEGQWETQDLVLEPCQCFFLVQLFGFRRHSGARRYTTALFSVARKNAKSSLAAAILLYVFCMEAEHGPQVLSAATTGDQARIVFNIAKRMVQQSPGLQSAFSLEAFTNSLVRYEVGGMFRPINAKASTQDGLNPSALCFDELHAHKTRDLFDVLRSAAGARSDPLFLYTTTEGYETPGPWPEIRHFAQQVLNRVLPADHFLAVYYALDDDDDDFDETKWVKANPMLGISVSLATLQEYATEARAQPGAIAEFQIKRLNRQAAAATGWVDLRRWRKCSGEVNLDKLVGKPCWGALDLASTRDMNAWRLLWRVDGMYYTWGRYWVPSFAVHQRTERRSVPYAAWVASGNLIQTEGDVADYNVIREQVTADWERFSPAKVAYDPWNATQLALELAEAGIEMEKFIQGPRSYHPAMQACEIAYISGNLRHGGDPVLLWNAANLVPRTDGNLNLAPDKKRSADKIDGMSALIMCFGLAALDDSDDGAGFYGQAVVA